MDSNQIFLAIVSGIIGAIVLLLVYMAARWGGYDGAKDAYKENGGRK